MKEKTYRRMTRRSPLRGLKLFKQKYLTKQRFYSLLAHLKLVREVRDNVTVPIVNSTLMNTIRMSDEKLVTDRGVFNLSFQCKGEEHRTHWWYESIFKSHKVLYTFMDETAIFLRAEVRSECEEFEIRIDPFMHRRVTRRDNYVYIQEPIDRGLPPSARVSQFKRVEFNFLKARMHTSVTLKVDLVRDSLDDLVKECVNRARVQIINYLRGNSEEINEKLTGVKFDGEFVSPDGQRLIPNCTCPQCGLPLFNSSSEGHFAQCVVCRENFYDFEVVRRDPIIYKEIYENNKGFLKDILSV